MYHVFGIDFRLINWLHTNTVHMNTIIIRCVCNTCLYCVNEIFNFAPHCRKDKKKSYKTLMMKNNIHCSFYME